MNLGERLRKAREDAGLSQQQVADISGVSQKTISKIERGKQEGTTQVAQLARACGVSTDWLATESGHMVLGGHAPPRPAPDDTLSDSAIEIARAWSKLPAVRREVYRSLMALEAIVANHYPWLTSGRPPKPKRKRRAIDSDILRLVTRRED